MRITHDIWSSLLRRERRSSLFVFFALALASFALSPMARAVDPPPDGGYPGQNTAEGDNALLSLTTGIYNTAIGFSALTLDTSGRDNTAVGGGALQSNKTGSGNTAVGSLALQSNTGSDNTAFGADALGETQPVRTTPPPVLTP